MTGRSTVLITGANRGLGLGLALAFARRGWRVIAACRTPAQAPELKAAGPERFPLDVCDEASVANLRAFLEERVQRLDILVNNAGINPGPRNLTVAEIAVGDVADAFDVNVLGALRVMQAALPALRRAPNPRVVNISSGAGSLAHNSAKRPVPAYSVSKAALNMLTRCAARDLPGITVVSVSPGWIRTDMGGPDAALSVAEAAEALTATIEKLTAAHSGQWLDRFGNPSEYAW